MKEKLDKDRMSAVEYESLLVEVERWRIVEELTDVIWSVDLRLNFTYVSPSVKNLFGYTQEEMLEKTLDQILTPESVLLIKRTLAEGMERHTKDRVREIPTSIEVEAKHRNGTSIWLELSRFFIRDEENNPIGIIGVARDISDRIQAAEALQESEAKYRALSEQSVLGIAIAQDDPVRLSYVNNTMEKLLGYSKEEMTSWRGAETALVIYPEDRLSFFETFRNRLENRTIPQTYEFRGVRKDSTVIWLEVHGTRIEYESKPAVLATFIDVTERYQAQKEVEEQRNFAEFLIDLMSHDLNNIHQGMMTALELMSIQNSITTENRNLLENSISQLARAGGLISNVKTLSDVKSTTIKLSRVDIHEPILKAIDSIQMTFPERKINIDFRIKPGVHFVCGCQFIIDVFYNILHNAVKADTNEPVVLEIDAEVVSDETSLQITVADRGTGIPDLMKNTIINRLSERRITRSGIGLTLVQQIIDQCHGNIWIEDRVKGDYSKGAKFVILMQLFQE